MKFLSEERAAALKKALDSDADFKEAASGASARIQQVVATEDGDLRYWLTLEDGAVDTGLGQLDSPDATITQDYGTAVELAKGKLSPVAGYMGGRIQVQGLMKLMQVAGAFSRLPAILASMDIEY